MAILYFTENVTLPKQFKKKVLKKRITDLIKSFGKKQGSINYIFCDNEKILKLNRQYLNHNYYTDILTFDYTKNDLLTGDIYISLETVKNNAVSYKTTFLEELYRVMIHGILHLCGIQDKTKEEKQYMTTEENKALEIFQKK